MIQKYFFDSGRPGPHVLVFGAIHGNELCGPRAITKICDELESGSLRLKAGSVTFVPVCNEQAYQKNVRYIEENLNRVFRKTESPTTYEQKLALELCPLVDACDVFLDIHSVSAPSVPNVILDFPNSKNRRFTSALGVRDVIVGWPELYAHNGAGLESYDTTRYAEEAGKIGVLVECGQHEDSASVAVADDVIRRALSHHRLIDYPMPQVDMRFIKMTHLFVKEHEADRFVGSWDNLADIPANTVVAERHDGTKISVDIPSVMIMPKPSATLGEEWFYLGVVEA